MEVQSNLFRFSLSGGYAHRKLLLSDSDNILFRAHNHFLPDAKRKHQSDNLALVWKVSDQYSHQYWQSKKVIKIFLSHW